MSSADTPMMQQFRRAKAEAGDALVFFRMGDFYELFHDDAVVASKALDLTLTARGKEKGGGYPMCGVPHQAADGYVARLVRMGHRVAICDQVEDPKKAKGLVKREVVRIVTPGTAMDEQALAPRDSTFVTALILERGCLGLAHAEISTGELRFSEHDVEDKGEDVVAELATFAPRELILAGQDEDVTLSQARARDGEDRSSRYRDFFALGEMPLVSEVDPWTFSLQHAREAIAEQFRVAGLGVFGLETRPMATRAVGAVLAYLNHTQRASLSHLEAPRLVAGKGHVAVDPTTRRNLELTENMRDAGRSGTLLSVLDRCETAMGGRTLRSFLLAPLKDVPAIGERHDLVGALAEDMPRRERFTACLGEVADIERLLSRAVLGSATPRDLAAMGRSLHVLPALRHELDVLNLPLASRLAGDIEVEQSSALASRIATSLVDEPPVNLRDGGVIREGLSAELDELRSISRDGRAHLAELESRERERTGVPSLKVRHNRVFGYYIELSKANLDKTPEDYERKQTLAGHERFVTPELKEMEGKILHAQERSLQLEQELFIALREAVAVAAPALRLSARAVGVADALVSLATSATAHGYVRPSLDETKVLAIEAGRHPVVELNEIALGGPGLGDGRFVPNDTDLDADGKQLAILTGPNMGGKSTYLRQVALITLMAQAGSFVPAKSARIGVVDKIFTRVGASDSLATGQSTFMVEMSETARILHEAGPRSLVVLDEIGRGTATFDGLSIAWAVAEYIHENSKAGGRTLFATHYHELTELALLYPRVVNLRMATRAWNDDIVFLHRVEEGPGDRSYGIQVARLAGLPHSVVERAREILENLERNDLDPTGRPRLAHHDEQRGGGLGSSTPRAQTAQLPLFGEVTEDPRLRQLAERLGSVHPDDVSPRQALDILTGLVDEARRSLE